MTLQTELPEILLIHTGGTLMMDANDESQVLEPDAYAHDLVAELPVLRHIAQIDTRILFNLDSADIQPHHWTELGALIHGEIDSFDGVVVVTGTDAMAYTASALTFLLPGLDKPVVLTGAQRPLVHIRTDARTNIVDACYLATLPIPEVGVAFASKLLRGCRTTKMDAWGMDAFDSPRCAPLVRLGLGAYREQHVLPPRPSGAYDPRIDPNVLVVRVTPGLAPKFLQMAIAQGVHGLVIEAFGTGNLPVGENSLESVLVEAADKDIPVVIVSQPPRATVKFGLYPGSAMAARTGAIPGGDMTTEAAVAKLMVLLGRAPEGRRRRYVSRGFSRALLGEMSTGIPFA